MKEASDPFEADAMEGWESMNYNMGVMSNLDKKFIQSSNWGWYLAGTVVVAATVVTFLVLNQGGEFKEDLKDKNPEKLTTLLEDQELTLEQTDIVLPDSINDLEHAPIEQQVEIKVIKKEFQEMKTTYIEELPPKVEMLPLDIRIHINQVQPEIIRDHKMASEIYLHDLKLVDYRKYRSKPAIKTKQVILTGTPANMEGEQSEDLTSEYREIDIPYIEYLSKTADRFSQGNYKNALSRFDVILQTYEDDVNANFYSGLCLYNLGQYETALQRFVQCTIGPYSNFDEEAQWYTALCYEKLGDKTKARSYFQKIVDQGGYYKKQAAAKLK